MNNVLAFQISGFGLCFLILLLAAPAIYLYWQSKKKGLNRSMTTGGQPVVEMWVGPPGNGKSIYATGRIVELLLYDTRPIIVSLAVRIHAWDNYMVEEFGFHDVKNRLFFLGELERRAFYESRGLYTCPYDVTSTESDGYKHYGYKIPLKSGAIYILDEVHKDFRARETGKTPGRLLEYLSQARQYGDRVIAITQHPKNVDVCFTRMADRFCTFTNTGKRKWFGIGFPRTFLKNDYSDSGMKQNSHEGFSVSGLDPKIAALYETAAAGGGAADTAEKSATIFSVPVIMAVVLFAACALLFYGPRKFLDQFHRTVTPLAGTVAPYTHPAYIHEFQSTVSQRTGASAPVRYVQSYMTIDSSNWIVRLSDGTRFHCHGRETLNGLLLDDGTTLPLARVPSYQVPIVQVIPSRLMTAPGPTVDQMLTQK